MPGKTVLLVEDDPDNRTIYQTILEYAGYSVLIAVNGREGVQLARQHGPDLILMDLSMPELDGWGAIAHLREDPCTATIPTYAISAHVLFDGVYERAVEAGFRGYITKPVEPKEVLQKVWDTIGEPQG